LVDYIKPTKVEETVTQTEESLEERVESMRNVVESYDDLQEEIDMWEKASLEDFIDEDELVQEEPSIEEFQEVAISIKKSDENPDLLDIVEQANKEGLVNKKSSTREIKDEDKPKFDNWGYKIRD
jgi:hypothetical protein